jgi:hypothetical protein
MSGLFFLRPSHFVLPTNLPAKSSCARRSCRRSKCHCTPMSRRYFREDSAPGYIAAGSGREPTRRSALSWRSEGHTVRECCSRPCSTVPRWLLHSHPSATADSPSRARSRCRSANSPGPTNCRCDPATRVRRSAPCRPPESAGCVDSLRRRSFFAPWVHPRCPRTGLG